MKILDRLNKFKTESDNIRLYISHIVATLNQLDNIDSKTPKTDMEVEKLEDMTDDLMVDMFEFIQWIANNYNQGNNAFDLGNELENELLNDFSVSTDILQRKLQRFKDIVKDSVWPFVWDETDFKGFTQSLTDGRLQGQIKRHLLKATVMPDFWDRMTWSNDYPYIINGQQLDESRAEQIAKDWVWRLEFYFRQGYLCQKKMLDKIEEAEQILNPQPDTTELPPIFQQYDIFKDNASVAKVFVSLIDEGLIKIDGNLFRWLDDRNSLCYFCYSLNLHYDLNTKNNNVPWVSFRNMFLCKIWGKWVEQTNNDLRDNWQQYLKNAKSEYDPNGEQGKILPPRGKQKIWEKIENSML